MKGFKATGNICHFQDEDKRGKPVKYFYKYDRGKITCKRCRDIIKNGI